MQETLIGQPKVWLIKTISPEKVGKIRLMSLKWEVFGVNGTPAPVNQHRTAAFVFLMGQVSYALNAESLIRQMWVTNLFQIKS